MKLKEQIEEIDITPKNDELVVYSLVILTLEQVVGKNVINKILQLIRERDKVVIGEDEYTPPVESIEDVKAFADDPWERNRLRAEQRKRAEETIE